MLNLDIYSRILKKITEPKLREGIHVSSLVYDCLRRGWYHHHYGHGFYDLKTLIRFWIGKAVHEYPLLNRHHLELSWNNIYGEVDDYTEEDGGIIFEKKTCKTYYRNPIQHHVRQLEYYVPLLVHNGYPVKEGYVVYINVADNDIYYFPVNIRPLKEIEKEMLVRRDILQRCIEENVLPPRNTSWLCRFCNFCMLCFQDLKIFDEFKERILSAEVETE